MSQENKGEIVESENKPPEEPHPDEPRDHDAATELADQLGNGETASDGEEQDEGNAGEPHPDEPSE
jgi:hypothetical protein